MPEYRVYFRTNAYVWVHTDSPSPKGVVQKAKDEAVFPALCSQCQGEGMPWDELDLCDGWRPYRDDVGYMVERIHDL